MHLAFLTPEFPHPSLTASAGIGTSVAHMATALAAKGVRVSVVVYDQDQDRILDFKGLTIHAVAKRFYRFGGFYCYRKFLQRYLNKLLQLEKIDAVEAPDWTGITAFMRLKCPLIIRMNGSDAYFCTLEDRPQKKKNFWFESLALKNADHLLAVSQFTARRTQEIFGLKKTIGIIPNSIDIKRFCSDPTVAEDSCTLLYFGTLNRKKGVLELPGMIEILIKKHSGVKLKLVGRDARDPKSGRSTRQLLQESFGTKNENRVEYVDHSPYDQVIEEIQKATVVVLPSHAEALPMAWLEAMAMQKALVTSDMGWAKEVMVDGETGFTVDPSDHLAFAKKVGLLLDDPNLRKKMGQAARQRVIDRFSAKKVADANFDFYQNLINR